MMMMLTSQKANMLNLWKIIWVLLDHDLIEFTSTSAEYESSSAEITHLVTFFTIIRIHPLHLEQNLYDLIPFQVTMSTVIL